MFKFETSVVVVLISLIGSVSNAADSTVKNCDAIVTELSKSKKEGNQKDIADWNDKLNKCLGGSTTDSSCEGAENRFRDGMKSFVDTCGSAGISGPQPAGNIACGYSISQCNCQFPSADSGTQRTCPAKDTTEKETTRTSSTGNVDGTYDLTKKSSEFKQCPANTGKDLQKVADQLKESQTRMNELDKKMPELDRAVTDAEKAKKDSLEKLQDDARNAQKDHKKELADLRSKAKDIRNAKSQKETEIQQNMSKLQEQLSAAQQGLVEAESSRADAQIKYTDTITKIELNCHSSASTQVAKLQSEAMDQIRGGSYNRGGFTNLMKGVGIDSRQSWQRQAQKYYIWCMSSTPTIDSKKAAISYLNVELQHIEDKKNGIRSQIANIKQQMNQLVSPQACGPGTQMANGTSGGDTQSCKNLQEFAQNMQDYNKDVQDSEDDFQAALQANAQKAANASIASEQAVARAQQAAAKAHREYDDEKTRVDNYRSYLTLMQEKNGTPPADAQAIMKAFTGYTQFNVLAKDVASSCHDCSSSTCKQARDYLKVIGQEAPAATSPSSNPDSTPGSTNQPSATDTQQPAPAPTPAPATGTSAK